MKSRIISGIFLVIALITFAAPNARAQGTSGFVTPSKHTFCAIDEGRLRCDMTENSAKIPPKPKDCEFDWGNSFEMKRTGSASRICVSDFVGTTEVLDYGKSWDHQGFHCNSKPSGLTCTNQSHHGWMLKQSEQRIF